MNTPAIAAVLPSAPPPSGGAPGAGRNDPDSATDSFSSVLARQHGAESAAPAVQAPGKKTEGKTGKQAADQPAVDKALVENASEQGVALPQMALHIAAEVAAVRHAAGSARNLQGDKPLVSLRHDGAASAKAAKTAQASAAVTDTLASALSQATDGAAIKAGPAADQPGQTIPAALIADAAIGARSQTATVAAPTAGRAASIAGAKQAILTMQARVQAGEASPDTIMPPDFLAAKAQIAQALEASAIAAPMELASAQGAAGHGHATSMASGMALGATNLGASAAQAMPGNLPAVATPLGNPNWGADFGRQFVSITQGATNMPHTAELRLDPPELGPLRISINISDNVANAVFVSPHAAVRQTVENALPQLQQLLAQAGISLGQTSVSDQGQPDQAFHQPSSSSDHSTGGGGLAAVGAHDGGLASAMARSPAPDALVDTFA